MKKSDTYTYELDGNLYINLTNKCSNACTFCVRNDKDAYFGHELWLEKEPSAKEVLARIPEDIDRYKEYVFCGFGEPTCRLKAMLEIARALKARGAVTRLNTNGQGSLINGRDISKDLAGAIDKINVSLNEATAEEYVKLCKPAYGEKAFYALQDFAKACAGRGIDVWFSVVDCIGQDKIEKCREIAAVCGVPLRVRAYIG